MSTINIDFETRSMVDLRKTGVYPYAEHHSTDVWCMAYSIDGGEAEVWSPFLSEYAAISPRLLEALPRSELRAWNSGFEHIIYREIMVKKYGFPPVQMEQWVDTAAEAAALALPRGLGKAAKALGMDHEKDKDGYKLMMKMARPRCIGAWWIDTHGPFATMGSASAYKRKQGIAGEAVQDDRTVMWWDHDEYMIRRLIDYCKQDVVVEQSIAEVLRELPAAERQVFLMNQRINDRGIYVDTDLVEAASALVERVMEEANASMVELTGGAVQRVTQIKNIREWLESHGITVEDLRKDTVRDLLADPELPAVVREVLKVRQDAGKTSTAKLAAFTRCVAKDGRAHGLLLYHGASTGRWSGSLVQPQNFPRPEMDPEPFIDVVLQQDYDQLREHGAPAIIISSMLRSMLRAAPGNTLLAADYSQIEARVLAWVAGQDDLTELFRSGGKVYETMAAFIFNKNVADIGKDSFERQIGKNSVLGAGFQMGARRFGEQVHEQTGIELTEQQADDAIKGYRTLYSRIPAFWKSIEQAAMSAVENPRHVYACGVQDRIKFTYRGQFLWCQLPSKRFLSYARPEIREKQLPAPWQDVTKPSLSYLGVDSLTKQWRRTHTYGGHLTENVVQAMARDLMAGAMLRVEQAGYNPILTVHDEVVVEAPQDRADFPEFMTLMQIIPKWADDLPVAAEGWQGLRYRK